MTRKWCSRWCSENLSITCAAKDAAERESNPRPAAYPYRVSFANSTIFGKAFCVPDTVQSLGCQVRIARDVGANPSGHRWCAGVQVSTPMRTGFFAR